MKAEALSAEFFVSEDLCKYNEEKPFKLRPDPPPPPSISGNDLSQIKGFLLHH